MKLTKRQLKKIISESIFDGGGDPRERRSFAINMFINTLSTLINAGSMDFDDGLASGFFEHHHNTFETLLNSSDFLIGYYATAHSTEHITFEFRLEDVFGVRAVKLFMRQQLSKPGANILPPGGVERVGEDCEVTYLHGILDDKSFTVHVKKLV